jgi:archaellum biogenesis ATPase FlaH
MKTQHDKFSRVRSFINSLLALCNGRNTLVCSVPPLPFPKQQWGRRSRVCDLTCTAVGDAQLLVLRILKQH